MTKRNDNKVYRIIIFVEGDTDEVFFKALLEYYRSICQTELVLYDVCNLKGVTRYTSKLLTKLKNEILPNARSRNISIQTLCCSYDTDVFEVRNPHMVNWDSIRKSVNRMGVCSSIEDWIADDIEGVCAYLKLKHNSLKGLDGNARLCVLYSKARRTYGKGYATREMINVLDFSKIRSKRLVVLHELEEALGVKTLNEPL